MGTVIPASWRRLTKARAVNSNLSAFPSKVPTATKPTGSGAAADDAVVFDVSAFASQTGFRLRVFVIGTGAADTTLSVRCIVWNVANLGLASELWIPTTIAEYLCTLSTAVGVAAKAVVNTERFADTLAVVGTSGVDGQGTTKFSPADNTVAYFDIVVPPCVLFEPVFDMGTATDGNILMQIVG